ncbi:MAG: CrcB family protein, partial [Chitinophagaceae bacterium]
PLGTLLINIVGSFVLGMVMAFSLRTEGYMSQELKIFLTTGICGGFTTFSAFSFENIQLFQSGKYNLALFYIIASVLFGILAAFLAFKLFTS